MSQEACRAWEAKTPKSPTGQLWQMHPLHKSGKQRLHSDQDMFGLWTLNQDKACGGFPENLEACKHQNLDHRGSSKFTARFFCKQCGTLVDEIPQAEARRRRRLRRDIATLLSPATGTTERAIGAEKEDVCLDQDAAQHLMTIFQQDLDLELESPCCRCLRDPRQCH